MLARMSRTLSTHDVAAPRRLAFWTDMVCDTYVQLQCDAPAGTDVIDGEKEHCLPLGPQGYEAIVHAVAGDMGGLQISHIA